MIGFKRNVFVVILKVLCLLYSQTQCIIEKVEYHINIIEEYKFIQNKNLFKEVIISYILVK